MAHELALFYLFLWDDRVGLFNNKPSFTGIFCHKKGHIQGKRFFAATSFCPSKTHFHFTWMPYWRLQEGEGISLTSQRQSFLAQTMRKKKCLCWFWCLKWNYWAMTKLFIVVNQSIRPVVFARCCVSKFWVPYCQMTSHKATIISDRSFHMIQEFKTNYLSRVWEGSKL